MEMKSILLVNGPNLDMLGTREPEVYGSRNLEALEIQVATYAAERGIAVSRFQSNHEGDLVDVIHKAPAQFQGIIYNPGAHTHYSYALRDAIASIDLPVVEVHISDVDQREPFRHVSVIAPACAAQVKGLGFEGYCKAVDILCELPAPVRLGEGYERNFADGANIRIAGQDLSCESDVAQGEERAGEVLGGAVASTEAAARLASAGKGCSPAAEHAGDVRDDGDGGRVAAADVAVNFAAEYAEDVAAEDAALQSAQRVQLVRDALAPMGVDSFLVRDTSNIRWLAAVDGVFDEERAHALLITAGEAVLHTDSRYANALRTRLGRASGDIVVDDARKSHLQFAHDILADEGDYAGKMAFEDSMTYAEYASAAKLFGVSALAASSDVVVGLRAVKDASEISRMLAAQAVTDAAFLHIVKFMRPGMTERAVQLELEDFMLRHGGEGLAFGSIVATGANGADPHAIPGDTVLEAGQCVVMDFGARAFGYCSDMTRTVFLGQPDGRLLAAWETLRAANESVEAMLRPGVTGRQAHELAEKVLADGGFEGCMGHGLGHGVGIDVHEQPVLNLRNDKPLAVGNVVTVEPGIYLPGQFGMRLEDCGVIVADGYEAFSQLGHEMVVI